MYNGDRMRKQTLVDYGFRLPSALDNRPLRFEEFEAKINQAIYVSATPGDYELEKQTINLLNKLLDQQDYLTQSLKFVKPKDKLII